MRKITTLEIITEVLKGQANVFDVYESDAGEVYVNTSCMLVWVDTNEPFEIVIGDNLKWEKI